MNKHLLLMAIVAMSLNACGPVYVVQQTAPAPAPPPQEDPAPAPPEDANYQTFYDQLSPYGQWIEDLDYGYVWMPDAGADFKPYATDGHWVYTDEGWTWSSDYSWGWAPFHYGRWFFKDGYGWMWVPGSEWAPAWVSWRNSDDYYGWAPLGPGIEVGVADDGGYNPPSHYWNFVPHQYIGVVHPNNYYVRETNNVTIITRTTIINRTTVINNNNRGRRFNGGPDPNEVGRFSGSPVHPMPIRDSRAPGGGATSGSGFAVYRPHVRAAPEGDARAGNGRPAFAPAHAQPINNVRPVNRNNYGGNPNASGGNGAGNPAFQRPQPTQNSQPVPGGTPSFQRPQPTTTNQPANNTPPAGNQQPGNHLFPDNRGYRPNPPGASQPVTQPANPPTTQPVNPPATQSGNAPAFRQSNQPGFRPGNQPAPGGNPAFQRPLPTTNNQPANNTTQPAVQGAPNNNPRSSLQPTVQPQRRLFTPPPAQAANPTQPRPVVAPPKPAPQPHNPPPPPKKDDNKADNKH